MGDVHILKIFVSYYMDLFGSNSTDIFLFKLPDNPSFLTFDLFTS